MIYRRGRIKRLADAIRRDMHGKRSDGFMVENEIFHRRDGRICRLNYARSTRIILPIEINAHFIKEISHKDRIRTILSDLFLIPLSHILFIYIFKIIPGCAYIYICDKSDKKMWQTLFISDITNIF